VLVERTSLGNENVNVRHADHETNAAIWQLFRHFDLVEIARLGVVDRRPRAIAEISNRRSDRSRAVNRIELPLGFGGDVGFEPGRENGTARGGRQIEVHAAVMRCVRIALFGVTVIHVSWIEVFEQPNLVLNFSGSSPRHSERNASSGVTWAARRAGK